MSDQDNPYKAPETTAQTSSSGESLSLPENVRFNMVSTGSWKRFLGVLGFIGGGFLILAGLTVMIGLGSAFNSLGAGAMGAGMGVVLGLVYIALGVFYFFPAMFLFRSGTSIKDFNNTDSIDDLGKATANSRKFWKIAGIYAIVMLALTPVAMIVSVVVAAASGF